MHNNIPRTPALPAYPPPVWMALGLIVLYLTLQVGASAIGIGVLALWHHPLSPGTAVASALAAMSEHPGVAVAQAIASVCVAASSVIWLVHRRWPLLWLQPSPPGFGLTRPRHRMWPAIAIAIGLLAPLLGGLMTKVLAGGHDITQNVQQLAQSAPLGWRIGLTALAITLAPLVEELLFRGVLLSSLIPRCGLALSVLLSACAFAAIHLPGLRWQWYAVPELLLLGIALAWLRLHYRSLWPSVLAHGTNNALALAVLFESLSAAN
ncbi:MAG: CPBP family intramembrane glutamic endopeptidase [Rhodanobacter sp.]